jgi:hypothetical protein
MQTDASKHLFALAVTEIPLNVRKNRWAKELCVIPPRGRQCRKTVDAEADQTMDTRHLLLSLFFHVRVGTGSLDAAEAESSECW